MLISHIYIDMSYMHGICMIYALYIRDIYNSTLSEPYLNLIWTIYGSRVKYSLVNTDDVIISSIEGLLDSCAVITEEYNNALCSTGFYIINSSKINSETLLVLFKSEPMQNILKKSCSGTILTAINKTEFQNIPVPIIEEKIQLIIKEKVSESFKLKKQSEQLLETAKLAVEMAIEQDEEEAIKYIESFNLL